MTSFVFPADFADLTDLKQVAAGGERYVYRSDKFPNLLFKKQKLVSERNLKPYDMKSFLLKNVPSFNSFIVRKEYRAYVDALTKNEKISNDFPITRLFGFVSVGSDLLQVVENVITPGREIGPTLGQLLNDKTFDAELLMALNKFARDLRDSQIRTNDVNANNIVLGTNRDGQLRFVLVDGFGDIHLLPVRTYFSFARRRHLIRLFSKLGKNALAFDTKSFQFCISDKFWTA